MFVKIDLNNIDYTLFDSIDLESWLATEYPEIYGIIRYRSDMYMMIGDFCKSVKHTIF